MPSPTSCLVIALVALAACGSDEQGKNNEQASDITALTDGSTLDDAGIDSTATDVSEDVWSDTAPVPLDSTHSDTLVPDAQTPDVDDTAQDAAAGELSDATFDCDACPVDGTCDICTSADTSDAASKDTTSAPLPGAGCPGPNFVDRLWRIRVLKDAPSPLRKWPANTIQPEPQSSLVAIAAHSVILTLTGPIPMFSVPTGQTGGYWGNHAVRLSGELTPVGTLVVTDIGEVNDFLDCVPIGPKFFIEVHKCETVGGDPGKFGLPYEALAIDSTLLWQIDPSVLYEYPLPLTLPVDMYWSAKAAPYGISIFTPGKPGQLFLWSKRGWWQHWSYPGKKLLHAVPQSVFAGILQSKLSLPKPAWDLRAEAGLYSPETDTVAFAVILPPASTSSDAPDRTVVFRVTNKAPHTVVTWTELDPKVAGDVHELNTSYWGNQLLAGTKGELMFVTKFDKWWSMDKELKSPQWHPLVACRIDIKGKVRWCRKLREELQLLAPRAVVDANGDLVVVGLSKPGYTPGTPATAPLHVVRLDHEGGHEIDRRVLDPNVPVTALPHIIQRNKPGFFASAGGNVYSLDAWFRHSCKSSGACSLLPWSTCDDKNPCTRDVCEPSASGGHTCSHVPLPNGATCAVVGATAVGFCGATGCAKAP